ncbi:MAG: (d)CMP kinase [Gammaproteobacteria bacterium]
MSDIPVITVDGPSGTGKGTLAAYLAHWLGWHFLDSGALYRILAFSAVRDSVNVEDEHTLASLARGLKLDFQNQEPGREVAVLLEGNDISQDIRTETCGNLASRLAAMPGVRAALLDRQRQFRQPPGLVADGRDMGTVVFPDAVVKIFLTASPDERARRRHKQLKEKGFDVNLAQLSVEIAERDARDSQRTVSPLRPADDAAVIDTTNLALVDVIRRVSMLVSQHLSACPGQPGDMNHQH